jgi:hypothetical protein
MLIINKMKDFNLKSEDLNVVLQVIIFIIFFVLFVVVILLPLTFILLLICCLISSLYIIYVCIKKLIINYTYNNGYVKIHTFLTRELENSIDERLYMAIKGNKIIYIRELLKSYSFDSIYDLMICNYCDNQYLIKHLFKDYNVNLFLKLLHYEFNDIKSIIYKYYIKLLHQNYKIRMLN